MINNCYDIEVLMQSSEKDYGLALDLIVCFSNELDDYRERLLIAFKDRNRSALNHISHTLKSTTKIVGASALHEYVVKLNEMIRVGDFPDIEQQSNIINEINNAVFSIEYVIDFLNKKQLTEKKSVVKGSELKYLLDSIIKQLDLSEIVERDDCQLLTASLAYIVSSSDLEKLENFFRTYQYVNAQKLLVDIKPKLDLGKGINEY